MRKVKKNACPKVGDFIQVTEKQYKHVKYRGVVTEVFPNEIQIYGFGYNPMGFHEFQLKEIVVSPIFKETVKDIFEQELLKAEGERIKSEIKFRESKNKESSIRANILRFMGEP